MDNRRQSSGGRGGSIAANPGFSGGAAGNFATLDWVVGLRVRVHTIIDDTYEGTIFSYDPLTSTLALTQSPTHPSSTAQDFRILKISFLKEVTVLGAAPKRSATPFTSAEPKIGAVNITALQNREKDAGRNEAERIANKGVGVSREGQEIFDALARIMQCRWHEKQIVVLGDVIIDEPYTPERVRSHDKPALNRVKRVLEGERRKLETARRSVTPVSGERKGG